MAAKNHIELVVKTLAVLEALDNSEYGKPLKEIAKEVGLVKSSAFRILFTLKEAGYVEQPETNGIYRLTLKTAGLSRRNGKRLGLATVARPHLIALRETLDESVALAERLLESVILIDVLETSHPLRLTFHIGDDCPIHATALGKAVAAFFNQRADMICNPAKGAPHTAAVWFNDSCFVQPGGAANPNPFIPGDAPNYLDNVRTKGARNLDLSLYKTFKISESAALRLDISTYNVTNTPQLGYPNVPSVLATAQQGLPFGKITSTVNTPRQYQGGVRLTF